MSQFVGFGAFGDEENPFEEEGFCPQMPERCAAELLEAIQKKNYPRAYDRLRRLEEPLNASWAGLCLNAALDCSPALFRAVLERCPPGEYAATEQWKLETIDNRYVNVQSTILTIAAARNKTRHMRELLARGWDVNAASLASAQAVVNACGCNVRMGVLCGSAGSGGAPESRLTVGGAEYNTHVKSIREQLWSTDRCTPLAAAIACGSEAAVRLLLKQPGVQREGSSAVCRAAVAALHYGVAEQMNCLLLVFRFKNPVLYGLDRELLGKRALDLVAVADMCTAREFTLRLCGVPCRREEARAAADVLLNQNCKNRELKLLSLLSAHPELGGEPAVRDGLLKLYVNGGGGKRVGERLLCRWKELCGEVRDISNAAPCLIRAGNGKAAELRNALSELRGGGELCAAAESAWLEDFDSRELLGVLSEQVRFYRAAREGISLLATLILKQGDARFLKKMAQRGMLNGEPAEELLAYASETKKDSMLRAMLLALPARHGAPAALGDMPEDGKLWSARLARMDAEGRQAWVRKAWTEPLDARESMERLCAQNGIDLYKTEDDDPFCLGQVFCSIGCGGIGQEEMDGMEFHTSWAAACCGKNPELLREIVDRYGTERSRRTLVWLSWNKEGNVFSRNGVLNGTMLCAAAAAGRTEQVRILLERGLDPNERDAGFRSVYAQGGPFGDSRIVTPLYMALEKGHEETARLLREHGGIVWPEREQAEACG